jgi:hypothetical protein
MGSQIVRSSIALAAMAFVLLYHSIARFVRGIASTNFFVTFEVRRVIIFWLKTAVLALVF